MLSLHWCFFLDADYEFVGMGNRHIPTKCIVLGKWDEPGNQPCKLAFTNRTDNRMVQNITISSTTTSCTDFEEEEIKKSYDFHFTCYFFIRSSK